MMSLLSDELKWVDENKHTYDSDLHAESVKENIKKRYRIAELEKALKSITSEETLHPIKDWAICGICSNSSSGTEGRKTRMDVYYKFIELVNKSKLLTKLEVK